MQFIQNYCSELRRIAEFYEKADAVLVGAGAGLSLACGYSLDGRRFMDYFADFHEKYGIRDMYSGGFFDFPTLEEFWAYWSRHIWLDRYKEEKSPLYADLLQAIRHKDYFVLTTNVDHHFQRAGFDKKRLFYTQGDYGLWQCSRACHPKTYDNREQVLKMVREQKDMKIPSELVPYCPKCGKPMDMNLRKDNFFVEDDGWEQACTRYQEFLERTAGKKICYLELGVGLNTPGIIKYPFWSQVAHNSQALYVCVNQNKLALPREIASRSVELPVDIADFVAWAKREWA